jgi:hypothetical protein
MRRLPNGRLGGVALTFVVSIKAASTTLQALVVGLQRRYPERFVINGRQLRVDPTRVGPAQRAILVDRYAAFVDTPPPPPSLPDSFFY